MCGITGFLTPVNERCRDEMALIATTMAESLTHRGPDAGGVWVNDDVGLALSHRRLAVIDLSAEGNQPMLSADGKFIIVFNGEIYNHRELRQELISHGKRFRGHSDTEVLLAGFECWGPERTIRQSVGMFAIALWDVERRILYLMRDRMGEKPIYYGWQGGTFLFGSELKAIRRHPDFRGEIDRDVLSLYFRYGYIPCPHSIYKGIYKLRPGAILSCSLNEMAGGKPAVGRETAYWSLADIVAESEPERFAGGADTAVEALESLIVKSLEGQMIADVPLGAFLSGGIDSSTIVALMQKLSSKPVKTFCIGFREEFCNEAVNAKQVAAHLGCDHTELYATPQEARDVIARLPQLYDEPFSDPSQIPTFLVSQLARQQVTVSLSGDAGDELFYGYRVYQLLFKRWRIARRLNVVGKAVAGAIAGGVHRACRVNREKAAVIAALLSSRSYVDLYRAMVSICHNPGRLVPDSQEPTSVLADGVLRSGRIGKENRIMALDALSYLPDDILVKVDRAAMACSLETRIPLLDHRIVEFAFRLPFDLKHRDGATKWLLRQIAYKYIPVDLIERPKQGFSIPLSQWLRQDLREWACDLLTEHRIRQDGVLDVGAVRSYLDEHLNARHDHGRLLWGLLMFQTWFHSN